MLQVSTEPINGGQKILNDNFGNRCAICGHSFGDGDICNNGHEWNKTYYILPEVPRPRKVIPFKGSP